MLEGMKAPIFVRPFSEEEQHHLQAGLRSKEAFVLRRCQILMASARQERAPAIARQLGCDDQTVRNVITGFNQEGLAVLQLPNVKWTQLLSQDGPDCNNNNVQWYEYLGKTFLTCSGHGLAMQEQSLTNDPEIYLKSIGGNPYDQKNFRVTVQVSFKDLSSTTTMAQLVVQTNAQNAYSGGYFFYLKPTGEWRLCQGYCYEPYEALRLGRVYTDMTRPVEMTIEVYKGHLFALINQTEVASIDDAPSSTARYIGLRVSQDLPAQTSGSATVFFSNFKLDGVS